MDFNAILFLKQHRQLMNKEILVIQAHAEVIPCVENKTVLDRVAVSQIMLAILMLVVDQSAQQIPNVLVITHVFSKNVKTHVLELVVSMPNVESLIIIQFAHV